MKLTFKERVQLVNDPLAEKKGEGFKDGVFVGVDYRAYVVAKMAEAGVTQRQVALALDMMPQNFNRWIKGTCEMPFAKIQKLMWLINGKI